MNEREPLDLPYYVHEPQVQRLPTLMNALREGSLRLPDFQRGYTWNDKQRLNLFDSILRRFPIGTLLVWRTSKPETVRTIDRIGPVTTSARGRAAELILDGHQRLTTLFSALGPEVSTKVSFEPEELAMAAYGSPADARTWAVYFDPTETNDDRNPFHLSPRQGPPPRRFVPLFLLLKNVLLVRFLASREDDLSEAEIARVEDLASRFKDYTIPVVPIVTDKLEVAVRSFERVNSGGTELTQFDIAHALGRTVGVDLNALFREVRESLEPLAWGQINDVALGYAIKLAVGLPVYALNTKTFVSKLSGAVGVAETVGPAMRAAIGFLRERCGVYGAAAIPYQFQLVLLTELFRRHADRPSAIQEDGVLRWFWMTTFAEHFASQRRIQNAMDSLDALARGEPVERVVDDPTLDPLSDTSFKRARMKGFFLWFARRFDPRDSNGASMQIPRELGEHGREVVHALVPRKQLLEPLSSDIGNMLLCSPENIESLRSDLLVHPDRCSDELLLSHGINDEAHDALVSHDYPRFIATRREWLGVQERAFVEPWGLRYVDEPFRTAGGDEP